MRPQHPSPPTVAPRRGPAVARVRRGGQWVAAAATLLSSLAIGTGAAGAEPNAGDLDTTFHGTGVAETAVFNDIEAEDTAQTPDGKLLVVARGDVWRFDSAGRIDPGFGGGDGVLDVQTQPAIFPSSVASLPDGRFVVAGFVDLPGGDSFGAARLLPDGSLDPSFGTDLDGDGAADQVPVFPSGSFEPFIRHHLVVQSTGHVVIVGEAATGPLPDLPAAGRISPDGIAGDVRVIASPLGTSTNVGPLDAAVGPGDRVHIAAGTNPDRAVAAIRLEADLDLDASFDGDGFAVEPDPGDEFTVFELRTATLSDGTVGVLAAALGSLNGVFLFRWDRNGDFLGRTGATFEDPVDQTSIGALVASGADGFLAAVGPLDTDPVARAKSVAVLRFDRSGDEESRAFIARPGFDLDARAGIADGDGGIVVAGEADDAGDRRLMLAKFSVDPRPETAFADDGLALIAGGGLDVGEAVAVTPDGGVIVGGGFDQGERGRSGFLVRHEENGRIDEAFGGSDTPVPGVALSTEVVHGVAVDERGRILAVGEGFDGDTGEFGQVERRRPDGTPDPSFGGGQPVRIDAPDDGIRLNAVTVDDEGRIVVVGTADELQASLGRFFRIVVVRLLDNGRPDPAFNDGEPVLLPVETEAGEGRAVAVQPDGGIVVAGSFNETPLDDPCCGGMIIARLTEDGTLDDTFGDRPEDPGLRFERIGEGVNRATGIGLRPDGRIVVAGFAADIVGGEVPVAEPPFAVAIQLLPDGLRDPSFGDDGLFTTRGSVSAVVGGVAIDDDGNTIVAGSGGTISDPPPPPPPAPPPAADDVVLVRLTQAGAPDDGFGDDGVVWTDLGGVESAAGVALDPGGRIVIGGSIVDGRGTRVLAARYHPVTIEPEPDPPDPPDPPEPAPPPPVFTPAVSLNPAVGRAGQTTTAAGSGFPPGTTVTFDWSRGIDAVAPVTVGEDGSFTVNVLVLPSEILGTRELIATTADLATGAPLTAAAPYLVAIGTSQPGDFVGRR
jgi:uncharacterized delta-60 repeat protein